MSRPVWFGDDSTAVQVRSVGLEPDDSPQRQREKLARIVLDDMYQFVALLDRDGILLEVNRAALEGGGMELEQIRGKPFWEARWWTISAQTQERLRQAVQRAATGEFVRYDVEIYGRAGGEGTIIIDFSLIPVFDAAGQVVFLLPEGRDITEKKAAEAEIARKNAELQSLYDRVKAVDEIKSQLFANVSHELRTPLSLILGPIGRILQAQNLSQEQRQDLGVVHRNAALLLKRVNDLLEVAKLDAGRMTIDYAPVDLPRLLRLLASNFDAVAAQRRIRFELELPGSLVVECDPEKVERIVVNLLGNAFKFTPDGGHIVLAVRCAGDQAQLSVQDSGPGVPASLRPQLFQRFSQGDGSVTRRVGGTGLGLSIVKDLVDLHQGSIGIRDTPGGGARFQLSLPLQAPEGVPVALMAEPAAADPDGLLGAVAEVTAPQQDPVLADAVDDTTRARVLVVEDNPELNRFLVQSLAPEFKISSADSGHSGLARARAEPPDLIVTDLMMPGLSGDQMIAELRSDPRFERIPIIVLSAKADEQLRIRLLQGEVQDYLVKPFAEAELRSRVRNLVGQKRRHDRVEAQNRDLEAAAEAREQALAASEARFRGLADAMPQIVWTADPQGRVDYYNRRWQEWTGRPRPFGDGDPAEWQPVVHPEDLAATIAAWERAVATGEGYQIEHRIQHADGSFRWMLSRAVPARDAEGRLLRWYGTATDIHDLKLAERALQRREHELRELTEAMPQLVWTADPEGTTTSCNRRWYEYTGQRPGDLPGHGWSIALHPEDLEPTAVQWQRVLRSGEVFETEYRIRGADGGYRWFLGRGVPLRDEGGRILRWLGTSTDIHAQKLLQQELERQGEELRQANQDLEQFAYVASHDMQEPLRMVSLNLGLIEDRIQLDDERLKRSFDYVRSGAARMRDLITSTMLYTRLTQMELGSGGCSDPQAVALEVLAGIRRLLRESGAMICLEVPTGLVAAPRAMLAQILQNLVVNACKYRSQRPLRIQLVGSCDAGWWSLSVEDNGIGIPPTARERIFDLFHRLRIDESIGGSGMGLTICRKLVERLGGRISCEPLPEGTRFRVRLPACGPPAGGASAA